MPSIHRRQFLQRTGQWVAGAAVFGAWGASGATGASSRVVLGLIGPGGMGLNHLRAFAGYPDVAIACVCDPDANHRQRAVQEVEKATGRAPQAVADLRAVLADPAVDAVVVATPDHWHAPATMLALEAGKHVYVEKPCAHNIREGRLMIAAAQRAKKIVQVGMQSRSSECIRHAMELLHQGAIGDVLVAKAWNSQLRASIGRVQPSAPPAHLDYDLWVGPAPMVPYRANLLHSSWRWFRAFGAGDAGNDGVHDLDIARWGLGATTHPDTITAMGGKYFFDDDQQFPDTQYVAFEYAGTGGRVRQLVYEHRIWSPYVQEGYENGNAFYGTQGMLILGKHAGWRLYGPRNELRQEEKSALSLAPHHRNFLESIRSGERPHGDLETSHLSASLAHLANIATDLRRTLRFDPARERFLDDRIANRSVSRTYRKGHWAIPRGV